MSKILQFIFVLISASTLPNRLSILFDTMFSFWPAVKIYEENFVSFGQSCVAGSVQDIVLKHVICDWKIQPCRLYYYEIMLWDSCIQTDPMYFIFETCHAWHTFEQKTVSSKFKLQHVGARTSVTAMSRTQCINCVFSHKLILCYVNV